MESKVSGLTIHGIGDFYSAKSNWRRCFWAIVCFTCFSAMTHQMYQLIVQYINSPILTKVTSERITDLPKLTFWRGFWLNSTAADAFNFTKTDYAFVLSLFRSYFGSRRWEFQTKYLSQAYRKSTHASRKQLLHKLKINSFQEFEKLILSLSINSIKRPQQSKYWFSKTLTVYGPCDSIEFSHPIAKIKL